MANQTYPSIRFGIRDDTPTQVAEITVLPIHIPLFLGFAEQGEVGVPVLGSYAKLTSVFGDRTFDERSPFYQHPMVFVDRACRRQQIYFVRLADDTAKIASQVVQVQTESTSVVQYQKDDQGRLILDAQGNRIPRLQEDGVTVVVEPGVKLTWSVRPFEAGEKLKTLKHTTVQVGGKEVVTAPIVASAGAYVGSKVNRTGFRLYVSSESDTAVAAKTKSQLLRFEPVQRDLTSGIVTPIRDRFLQPYADVSFKTDALDPSTMKYYDLSEIIRNDYTNGLPYDMQVYSDYVKLIAEKVLAVSPELDGLDPYQVNIFTGETPDGVPYDHVVVEGASSILNENVILYNQGGSDGTMTKESLEALTIAYLSGDVYPELGDSFRYPFTHLYDSGYSMEAKDALINFLSYRLDVKIDLSTQDVANPPNTPAEDQSTGSYLRGRALLHPESVIHGTPACRVSITQQCGYLNDTQTYRTHVPLLLDRLVKRCIHDGKTFINSEPKGRPNSEVTMFRDINWTPSAADHKQLSWDTGLNYAQYCDISTIHYPDIRSIYPIDESLLSDDLMTDKVIYHMKIVRDQWTQEVGKSGKPSLMFDRIGKAIDKRASFVFSGTIRTLTTVFQTDADKLKGYRYSVQSKIYGSMPNRVWDVTIPVGREEE